MKLKYNHNGETNEIKFSTYQNTPKPRVAIQHNNQTWYVPRVAADNSSASELTFRHNNTNCALKTDATVPAMVFSDSNNPASSTDVTLYSNYGDFGVIGDSLGSGGNGPGAEYYFNLSKITATEPNSTIIGNKNNNFITVVGGNANVITGGIGHETFTFHSGGGLIKDFGSGCVKYIDKKYKAGLPSDTVYNRTDPSTYKEGVDILQVYGRIKNIAFENYGAPNSSSNKNEKFEAYVIYTADMDGKDYVIKLDNIYKIVANYISETYRTDAVVVKSIFEDCCYDTRNGSLDKLGSAYSDLCSTIEDSPYKTLIEEFNAMIVSKE